MINGLIEPSLRNRLLVVGFFALVGVWGCWALLTTPLDAIPDLSDNQVIVFADWPGRSPQEIEDQVTYPLTVSLQGLPGVRVVRSSSAFGFSMINVIFEDAIDLYFARPRVLEGLQLFGKALPSGVVPTLGPDARQRLLLLGLSAEQTAALTDASQVVSEVSVQAPADGLVIARSVNPGQVVGAGQDLFVVTDLTTVDHRRFLREGLRARPGRDGGAGRRAGDGCGARYRYSGTVMGFRLDFSEVVTRYTPGREKVWRTIGEPRLATGRRMVQPVVRAQDVRGCQACART